jgi:hypothetical protein
MRKVKRGKKAILTKWGAEGVLRQAVYWKVNIKLGESTKNKKNENEKNATGYYTERVKVQELQAR